MAQVNDLSRSLTPFDPISTLVVVVEMSKAKWLVSGAVPGIERQPIERSWNRMRQQNILEELQRDMARLALVREQIKAIEKTREARLEQAPDTGPHAMVRLLARVIGIGIETADMLVREILSRRLRDRRAVFGRSCEPGVARGEALRPVLDLIASLALKA